MKYKLFAGILAILNLSLSGCIDKDYDNIDNSIVYDAEFSVPLGDTLLTAGDFVKPSGLMAIPDSVDKDTVSWFLYDNTYYFSPGSLSDTSWMNFSLGTFFTDTSEVVSLSLRINAVNHVPARMLLQFYFADGNRVILDSIFQDGPFELKPAVTSADGHVTTPYEVWKKDIPFSQEQIGQLANVRFAMRESRLIIPDSATDSIPFYADQEVWLQMGVRIGLKIKLQ